MIRCVLFDVGGVLMRLGEAEYRKGVAERMGLAEMPPAYDAFAHQLQRGEVDEVDVWQEVFGVRVSRGAFDDIFERTFPVNHDMVAFAAELRQMGLLTAVLSNTQASHVRVMRRLGFLEGFHRAFMSNEIGARKPEPAVYRLVSEELGLEPQSILFIDDIEEYVAAANAFGIRAIRHTGDVAATRARVLSLIEAAQAG